MERKLHICTLAISFHVRILRRPFSCWNRSTNTCWPNVDYVCQFVSILFFLFAHKTCNAFNHMQVILNCIQYVTVDGKFVVIKPERWRKNCYDRLSDSILYEINSNRWHYLGQWVSNCGTLSKFNHLTINFDKMQSTAEHEFSIWGPTEKTKREKQTLNKLPNMNLLSFWISFISLFEILIK